MYVNITHTCTCIHTHTYTHTHTQFELVSQLFHPGDKKSGKTSGKQRGKKGAGMIAKPTVGSQVGWETQPYAHYLFMHAYIFCMSVTNMPRHYRALLASSWV